MFYFFFCVVLRSLVRFLVHSLLRCVIRFLFTYVTRSLMSCLVRSIVHFLIRSIMHYLGTKTQVLSSKLFSLVDGKRLLNIFTR